MELGSDDGTSQHCVWPDGRISQKEKDTWLVKLQCFSGPIRVLEPPYSHASFMDLHVRGWCTQCLNNQQSQNHLLWLLNRPVTSKSLQPHGLQQARPPCPSLFPGIFPSTCPLNRWCYPTISSSAAFFSFCLQSSPASGYFLMSWLRDKKVFFN